MIPDGLFWKMAGLKSVLKYVRLFFFLLNSASLEGLPCKKYCEEYLKGITPVPKN